MKNIQLPNQLDLGDIQGLIINGYTHPCSVHLMFNFSSSAAALKNISGFFKDLLPYVQSAEDWGALKPEFMLNIGLTADGIAIVKPELDIQNSSFSTTFKKGPWDANNAQQSLGDYGAGDPSEWWNKKFKNEEVHCVVHAYAMNPGAQDRITEIIGAAVAKSDATVKELKPLLSETGRLEQYLLVPSDFIHFRYRDSIDEPNLNDDPAGEDQQDLNNFLIGYSTLQNPIPGPLSGPEAKFAKNGCYNAFRILYQDAEAFYTFLEQQAVIIAPQIKQTEEFTIEWLAAKLCGRWRNGSPLVLSPEKPEQSTSKSTDFMYLANDDMKGLKCPFSAHTRVSNPRDEGVDVAGSTTVPRLLRRGMAYGPPLSVDADADRGLIGMFLCGDLNTQFETIYGWINMNNFSDVFNPANKTPQDPLVANRIGSEQGNIDIDFTIPMEDGTNLVIKGPLPQFIVTRGTAYCLLPSVSSLREIATFV
ncbi:Dyp-type peroxidase [Flavobacterium sp. SM2513]|uniref:Dyp-type peroxidase n=1 Tax=Flavobacterium sp. SM2513 TaxID=3424766 RepID=UPI003D7FBDCA